MVRCQMDFPSFERQVGGLAITPAFERIVEANTLLSGLGFESGGLASPHIIHNGLTALEETHAYYHGEKVAFGVLAGLQLTDDSPEESDLVFSFCENIGLPTTLADIGIRDIDCDKLFSVSQKACAPTEGIHHEAGEITPEKALQAMLAANAIEKELVLVAFFPEVAALTPENSVLAEVSKSA